MYFSVLNPLSSEYQSLEDLMHDLAQRTDGWSGAALHNLCQEAAMLSLRDKLDASHIEPKHFFMALERSFHVQ